MDYAVRLLVNAGDETSQEELFDLIQTALYDAELDAEVIFVEAADADEPVEADDEYDEYDYEDEEYDEGEDEDE